MKPDRWFLAKAAAVAEAALAVGAAAAAEDGIAAAVAAVGAAVAAAAVVTSAGKRELWKQERDGSDSVPFLLPAFLW